MKQGERQLGVIELTLALVSLLVALSASWANSQTMDKETFDWHWGSWRVKVSENQVFIYRHQSQVLELFPPPETNFKEEGHRFQTHRSPSDTQRLRTMAETYRREVPKGTELTAVFSYARGGEGR